MKKTSLFISSILLLSISFILMNCCNVHNDKVDYLREVLHNLEEIKSATYYSTITPYAPGDTAPDFTAKRYYKEYVNPADTFVGAKFVRFPAGDTTEVDFCYDGNMTANVWHKEKAIVVDSFETKRSSYRYMDAPFFTKAKTLIKYVLETKDSLLIESIDMGDSIQYSFSIYDTIAEVIGNRIVYFPVRYYGGPGIKYDLWIHKSNGLPYRFKRETASQISIIAIKNVKLNHLNILDFKATDYFPPDFAIKKPRESRRKKTFDFVGKKAPDWELSDRDSNFISLRELKSKVILIQFTGVSCGACTASIPFLKQLVTEYNSKDFGLVGIECWSNSLNALSKYQNRNDIQYTFLKSDNEVSKNYQIQAVPVFFLLDENRIIRKVINGYGASVDKEISDAINELI